MILYISVVSVVMSSLLFLFFKTCCLWGEVVFIHFLVAMDLCCCMWDFSSCDKRKLLFIAVHRLLIELASPVAEHRLGSWGRGLSSCGLQVLKPSGFSSSGTGPVIAALELWTAGSVGMAHGLWLLLSIWNPPRPGTEPMSLALAGRFPSTAPPGESLFLYFWFYLSSLFLVSLTKGLPILFSVKNKKHLLVSLIFSESF